MSLDDQARITWQVAHHLFFSMDNQNILLFNELLTNFYSDLPHKKFCYSSLSSTTNIVIHTRISVKGTSRMQLFWIYQLVNYQIKLKNHPYKIDFDRKSQPDVHISTDY